MLIWAGIVSTVLQIILLIVIAGLVIVGGLGALLSRSRGGTLAGGFLRSVIVPPWPLGWLWVLWSTRGSKQTWTDQWSPDGRDDTPPPVLPTSRAHDDPAPSSGGGRRF